MLYTAGAAWLNGSEAPKSAALFSGDLLQTRSDSTANIQANGSSVMVMADSLIKYEGPAVELEHGGLRVTTSKSLVAHVGDVTIQPAGNSWTEFQVVDVDGRVQIAANKGDVTVQDDQGTTTVSQGQQTTRDDTANPDKKKKRRKGAAAAGAGGIMSSPWAIAAAGGGIAGGLVWILLQNSPPASPACPTNPCQ
ncbi:MAG TPA: FecR family protein [Dongiaceae bacterium]|nr:FecR family protein [Dongiaceae bacterium]